MVLTRDCLVFDLIVSSMIVFDNYRDHSLNSATRDKRRQGRVLFQYQVRDCTIIKHTVSAPVSCSWQGTDSSLVASARAVKISLIYIFYYYCFWLPGRQPGRRYFCQGICPGMPWCGASTENASQWTDTSLCNQRPFALEPTPSFYVIYFINWWAKCLFSFAQE